MGEGAEASDFREAVIQEEATQDVIRAAVVIQAVVIQAAVIRTGQAIRAAGEEIRVTPAETAREAEALGR